MMSRYNSGFIPEEAPYPAELIISNIVYVGTKMQESDSMFEGFVVQATDYTITVPALSKMRQAL